MSGPSPDLVQTCVNQINALVSDGSSGPGAGESEVLRQLRSAKKFQIKVRPVADLDLI